MNPVPYRAAYRVIVNLGHKLHTEKSETGDGDVYLVTERLC